MVFTCTRSSSVVTLAQPSTRSTLSQIALSDMHHLVSGINFLTPFVSLGLIYLLQIHHFFLITSVYQFQRHHSLLPSHLHFFILASKPFFSINPTFHRPLHWYPPDWFHGLLDCSSAFFAQRFYFFQFFSNFSFQNRFPLQLFFSSSLLQFLYCYFSPSFSSFGESLITVVFSFFFSFRFSQTFSSYALD